MNYYPIEEYDDFDGEPLPEDLIEEGIDENGYIHFGDRMILVMDLACDVGFILQQRIPSPLRDRIATRWAIDHNDYASIREDMDMFIEGR